jgi:hypothetical protein
MEVISENQITFLLFQFILNNIFLTCETISRAKKSKQPMLSLKLDFSKAYDKVEWMFLFESMFMIRIGIFFVNMTKLLYNGATTSISINGKTFETFVIKKGVRQGWPLAPCLFRFMGRHLMQSCMLVSKKEEYRVLNSPIEIGHK